MSDSRRLETGGSKAEKLIDPSFAKQLVEGTKDAKLSSTKLIELAERVRSAMRRLFMTFNDARKTVFNKRPTDISKEEWGSYARLTRKLLSASGVEVSEKK